MLLTLGEEYTLTKYANYPQLRSHRLGVIIGVSDGHILQIIILRNDQSLSTEGKEIANDWAVLPVPFPLRDATLLSDNIKELASKWETLDSRNVPELRNVEGEDPTQPDDEIEANHDCPSGGNGDQRMSIVTARKGVCGHSSHNQQ